MISMDFKFIPEFKPLKKKAEIQSLRKLFGVGGYVSRIAKNSIRSKGSKKVDKEIINEKGKKRTVRAYKSSKPGSPPFTHQNKALKRSIKFKVDKTLFAVSVGPTKTATDGFAKYHEFGLKRGKIQFPKRPFMGPALTKALPRLPEEFRNIL